MTFKDSKYKVAMLLDILDIPGKPLKENSYL